MGRKSKVSGTRESWARERVELVGRKSKANGARVQRKNEWGAREWGEWSDGAREWSELGERVE